ncbi:DUF397 domain-containing protein [Streptomyces violaceorubidus]|uniref:DUF397 domain-containing protein n=1 Tax=Streptomyces violaceorubidus TaxID=284042 RepID=A0ABV1SPH9_9ACTN
MHRGDGGNRVEVAYEWRGSSRSGDGGGNRVEAAREPAAVHPRDSTAPQGHLTVVPDAWAAFLGAR